MQPPFLHLIPLSCHTVLLLRRQNTNLSFQQVKYKFIFSAVEIQIYLFSKRQILYQLEFPFINAMPHEISAACFTKYSLILSFSIVFLTINIPFLCDISHIQKYFSLNQMKYK